LIQTFRSYQNIFDGSLNGSELGLMHKKWKEQYDELEDDLEKFRNYFAKTKKCNCNIDECIHFDHAMYKVFSKKVDELWNLRLQVGFRTVNLDYGVKR